MKLSNGNRIAASIAVIALTSCSSTTSSSIPGTHSGASSVRSTQSVAACAGSFTPAQPGQGGDPGPFTYARMGNGSHVTIDASGCDVGIYVPAGTTASIDHADIHDADKYAVFVDDGATFSVDHTTIEKIGNHTAGTFDPNGVQTGDGIWVSNAKGTIDHTTIAQYQKNGYSFRHGAQVGVEHSSATGLNAYGINGQNGFVYLSADVTDFQHNSSTANHFVSGPEQEASGTGYLFCSQTGTIQTVSDFTKNHNDASNNDVNYVASPSGTAAECS